MANTPKVIVNAKMRPAIQDDGIESGPISAAYARYLEKYLHDSEKLTTAGLAGARIVSAASIALLREDSEGPFMQVQVTVDTHSSGTITEAAMRCCAAPADEVDGEDSADLRYVALYEALELRLLGAVVRHLGAVAAESGYSVRFEAIDAPRIDVGDVSEADLESAKPTEDEIDRIVELHLATQAL